MELVLEAELLSRRQVSTAKASVLTHPNKESCVGLHVDLLLVSLLQGLDTYSLEDAGLRKGSESIRAASNRHQDGIPDGCVLVFVVMGFSAVTEVLD